MKLKIDEKQFLAAVDHEGDHEVGAGKFPDDKRANSTFANSENASNDPECTDCRGTGVTLQTERRCHCQPLPPNEIDQAMQELNRQHDVYAAAREEYRKKIAEQAARIEQLENALREIEKTGKFAAQVPGPRNCLMEICETARAALGDHFVGVNKMVQAQEIERLRAALLAFAEHFGPLEDNEFLHEDARRCFALARAALGGKHE